MTTEQMVHIYNIPSKAFWMTIGGMSEDINHAGRYARSHAEQLVSKYEGVLKIVEIAAKKAPQEPMSELKLLQAQVYGLSKGIASLQGRERQSEKARIELNEVLRRRKAQAVKDSGQINKLFAQLFMAKRDLGCTLSFEAWRNAWLYHNGYKDISEAELRMI